jgi:hypothetical protein
MKTTLDLYSFIQRFKSLSGKKAPWSLTRAAAARAALLILFAFALAAFGGWERLTALADVVPGGYVQIQPNAATLNQGATFQLRGLVLNPLGFELPNRKITWTSSNPAIAGVSGAGLVIAVAPGIVTITAKSGAALGTATITVNGPVLPPPNTAPSVSITAPTDGATFQQGDAITYTATATDAQDGNLSALIVWTATLANNPSVITPLGTGASVSSASLAPGSYLITASVRDSGGLAGIAQVGITVNSPCTLFVNFAPSGGEKISRTYLIDARPGYYAGTYDTCGRPLKLYWDCTSLDVQSCVNFLQLANANGNTTWFAPLEINDYIQYSVQLTACVEGANECRIVYVTYSGVPAG